MKSTSYFLSNEKYSTSRGQKLTKVKNFKAHTAKNKGFFRIFMTLCSQRVFLFLWTLKKSLSCQKRRQYGGAYFSFFFFCEFFFGKIINCRVWICQKKVTSFQIKGLWILITDKDTKNRWVHVSFYFFFFQMLSIYFVWIVFLNEKGMIIIIWCKSYNYWPGEKT